LDRFLIKRKRRKVKRTKKHDMALDHRPRLRGRGIRPVALAQNGERRE
jgi:hypothetical protein